MDVKPRWFLYFNEPCKIDYTNIETVNEKILLAPRFLIYPPGEGFMVAYGKSTTGNRLAPSGLIIYLSI